MRGLNLSRLAARGRASESVYFKDVSASQANKLRKKLPSEEKAARTQVEQSELTVDRLSSISAHSVYKTFSAPDIGNQRSSRVLSAVREATQSADAAPVVKRPTVDPQMLRTLGSGKLGILNELPASRALPGGERYAEGAALGIASFGVATGIVSVVGLVGGVVLYYNPGVVEGWRGNSLKLRDWLEERVGGRLEWVRGRMRDGYVGQQAKSVAAGVMKQKEEEKVKKDGSDV